MGRRRIGALVGSWLVVAGAVGCSGGDAPDACAGDEDCAAGLVCRDGACASPSDGDASDGDVLDDTSPPSDTAIPDGDAAVPDADAAADTTEETDADAETDADVVSDAGGDADTDAGPTAGNGCGGDERLLYDGRPARPGDGCGCGGVLQCAGADALACLGAGEPNACGSCPPLAADPGDVCGPCGGGVWSCAPDGTLACEDAASSNPCGGCEALDDDPGASCSAVGIVACSGPDALVCVEPADNACGGSAPLDSEPGSPCGVCDSGRIACAGTDLTICEGQSEERNACGGCAPLAGTPGASCGSCGGVWACEGTEAVLCSARPNACGGCSELLAAPGSDCGDGIEVCDGPDATRCDVDATNACGGTAALAGEPGTGCGLCGGVWACAGPDAVGCVGAPAPNACGGCAALTGVPGERCGIGHRWACDEDGQVACVSAEASATLTPELGGTLAVDGMTLVVPPGAVSDVVYARVRVLPAASVAGFRVASTQYEFLPAGTTFGAGVTVSIRTDGDPGAVVIWSNDGGDGYVALDSERSGDEVVATVAHFSVGFGGVPMVTETECTRRWDDDGDGLIDCEDEDCADAPNCTGACAGVDCFFPPAPVCVGDRVFASAPGGVCDEGVCYFDAGSLDCAAAGRICVDGVCVDPECIGVTCATPPDSYCLGDMRVGFVSPGVCSGGTCGYAEELRWCRGEGALCIDGECVEDPCGSVVCVEDDWMFCDGDVLNLVRQSRVCADGACVTETELIDCVELGGTCELDRCVVPEPDPCEGVVCNTPAAVVCDGNERVQRVLPGRCEAGTCRYDEARTDCAATGLICESGACVEDLCAGVVCDSPAPPRCTVGDLLVTARLPGTCFDGMCYYEHDEVDCGDVGGVCRDNACVVDPCAGVTCDSPPRDYCDGETLYDVQAPGVCVEGVCSYTNVVTTDCAALGLICNNRRCEADPWCEGISCTMPPSNYCMDGDTAVRFSSPGRCDRGECLYDETVVECAGTCSGGSCVE